MSLHWIKLFPRKERRRTFLYLSLHSFTTTTDAWVRAEKHGSLRWKKEVENKRILSSPSFFENRNQRSKNCRGNISSTRDKKKFFLPIELLSHSSRIKGRCTSSWDGETDRRAKQESSWKKGRLIVCSFRPSLIDDRKRDEIYLFLFLQQNSLIRSRRRGKKAEHEPKITHIIIRPTNQSSWAPQTACKSFLSSHLSSCFS